MDKPEKSQVRERVAAYRARLREEGMRPIQIWVPDVRSPEFRAEAHRQSAAVAGSEHETEDQTFIDEDLGYRHDVRRGETWTVSGTGYAGKPRPCAILQDDRFDGTGSVTICVFTSDPTEAPLFRLLIEPSSENGLASANRLMGDKVTTVPRARLGEHLGRLAPEDMTRLDRAILVFLGLAD